MDTSAPSDNAFPSSGGALITGNETERTREFKDVVPVLLKRMMDADGIRPSMIRSGPVLVNGKKLERGNRGAVLSSHRGRGGALKLLDKQGEQGGGFVEDDACSTSGKETGKSFWKALDRCIAASIKGFVIGGGLRGGLSLFAILSRLRKRSSFSTKGVSLRGRTNNEAIMAALKETLRYGLFVGTFAGVFCTVDETVAAIGGCHRTARWRSLVAGAVAGPSLLLTGHKKRHTSMALYILVRAAVLAARCGIKNERTGWLCRPLSWRHGDTFLMCLSSSQILSAWILKPDSLPSSYIAFLNKHGGKDLSIIRGFKELALKMEPFSALKAIEEYYKSNGVDLKLDPNMSIPCTMLHGNQGCMSHFFSFLGPAYLRSLPVYLPVYFVPALLVHRQGLFVRPFPILWKSLIGTARSSLFLAVYCASAWSWTCVLFRATGTINSPLVAAATFPVGLALMIEKKSRRMEIALYCFARAMESFAICVTDWGLLERYNLIPPKRFDVLLFSTATAIIMHCYAQERDVFRSKYLNVLDWVFGLPDGATPYTPLLSSQSKSFDAKFLATPPSWKSASEISEVTEREALESVDQV